MLISQWLSKLKRRLSDRGVATGSEILGKITVITITIDVEARHTIEEGQESAADVIMIAIMNAAGGVTTAGNVAVRGTDVVDQGIGLR